jgi:glucose/arabinose dehydrogenase
MTNKKLALIGFVIILIVLGFLVWKHLPGLAPILLPPSEDITDKLPKTGEDIEPAVNDTEFPLSLPDGFKISIFAENLPGARVMKFDSFGNLWVSQTKEGAVSLLLVEDGQVVNQNAVLRDLRRPHGLAFDPENQLRLYFVEEHQVSWIPTYSEGRPGKILDLPSGDGHFTRTLGFGPDGKLYISVGSSCNVCHEKDERRATIIQYNPQTDESKIYARGLRNAVFFVWDSLDKMWATEMGRDWLGDDLPPDEVNIIEEDKNYGWPTCYGKNIHDVDFDKGVVYIRPPCQEPFETPSFIDIPAHSAPLGLVFAPDGFGPADYSNDLFVVYHGSWNRSVPTGYKLVRHKFDSEGNYQGVEDFISGWLLPAGGGALGRPVDIVFHKGAMHVSDDRAGVIYKVEYIGR